MSGTDMSSLACLLFIFKFKCEIKLGSYYKGESY